MLSPSPHPSLLLPLRDLRGEKLFLKAGRRRGKSSGLVARKANSVPGIRDFWIAHKPVPDVAAAQVFCTQQRDPDRNARGVAMAFVVDRGIGARAIQHKPCLQVGLLLKIAKGASGQVFEKRIFGGRKALRHAGGVGCPTRKKLSVRLSQKLK